MGIMPVTSAARGQRMSDDDPILLERSGAVATIRFNRPEKLNAFRHTDYEVLLSVLEQVDADDTVRAVIITGSGRAFSTGDDFAGYSGGPNGHESGEHPYYGAIGRGDLSGARISRYRVPLQVMGDLLMTSSKVYIGAVNGVCWAPEILYACDFAIASDRASFGQGDMMIGICPGGGSTQTLPRLVGRRKALDIMLRPREISADEARDLGIVNEVVAHDELMERVEALALELAAYEPAAVKYTKLAVTRAQETSLAIGLDLEQEYMALSITAGGPVRYSERYWAERGKNSQGEGA
ncbi:enoyl-CoA hydratase/isomerase family protein [Nocardioides sp.]|uniref:enoyl-CoA hydratase/isomerase family protein n=1 Tax=Nocardioides sp. TaxID=35761 RepID=UPI0039E64FE7